MKKSRLSDQIAEQLEQMIAEGGIETGQRLPSERKLAERLQVSRPSLREAIQKLSSKGLLESRQGGGTYVTRSMSSGLTDPLLDLLKQRPEFRFDILEVRHALDGQAAYYAALRATDEDREQIRVAYDEMMRLRQLGEDPLAEARADAAFHISISEASHNAVLLHLMRSLFTVLQESIQHNLDKLYTLPRISEPLNAQHHKLMEAVINREPEQARLAAQEHLVFVEESLQEIDKEQARHERFLRQASILSPESGR
jgi:DNA-binding FadR family transcriptional regulator